MELTFGRELDYHYQGEDEELQALRSRLASDEVHIRALGVVVLSQCVYEWGQGEVCLAHSSVQISDEMTEPYRPGHMKFSSTFETVSNKLLLFINHPICNNLLQQPKLMKT